MPSREPGRGATAAPAAPGRDRRPSPVLSVVVPVYHEATSIAANLARLRAALDGAGMSWEVVVVVDGDPATLRAGRQSCPDGFQVLGYTRNRGKGFAIRYGMARTRGELVTIIDGDLDIAPEEIGRMAALLQLYDADMVIGSKRHPLSEVTYPRLRRLQSFAFQVLVRMLFRVRVRDTQTGLKVMRREVALRVLDVALVKRFAFDVELIALARHFGYRRILEAPVRIDFQFRSTTNLRAVAAVLWDTAAIFYRLQIRHWYDRSHPGGRDALLAAGAEAAATES
ncbi:MAG TPA: glycosyltransferase [Candidatus Micrarchaeia archaeon]|nr:glycosyltransferase [Candidatus Micrarchaeia archaeon]